MGHPLTRSKNGMGNRLPPKQRRPRRLRPSGRVTFSIRRQSFAFRPIFGKRKAAKKGRIRGGKSRLFRRQSPFREFVTAESGCHAARLHRFRSPSRFFNGGSQNPLRPMSRQRRLPAQQALFAAFRLLSGMVNVGYFVELSDVGDDGFFVRSE